MFGKRHKREEQPVEMPEPTERDWWSDNASEELCPVCKGRKMVMTTIVRGNGRQEVVSEICDNCGGCGTVPRGGA